MRPSQALQHHREALLTLSTRHGLRNVRVFGSAARSEDRDGSDLDLLVDPTPDSTTLFDIVAMKEEAQKLLGVSVDVRTIADIHERFRARVIKDAKPL
ncbi:MAG: nucleotidyltransferase family protein [Acetobacteraceae bacterium]|jgi:predicted nucleotidyltransferase